MVSIKSKGAPGFQMQAPMQEMVNSQEQIMQQIQQD